MDLNKIKLLNKEELLQKLKQNKFNDVARILEDKGVNGQILLEITEFELIRWRLSPYQKKILWNCIKCIKENPQILMVMEKPNLPKKSSDKDRNVDIDPDKQFKNKLGNLLAGAGNTVGSSLSLPKVNKNKSPPTTLNEKTSSGTLGKKGRSESFSRDTRTNKPLPPSPPPSPPPRTGNSTVTDNRKKFNLSTPKKKEIDPSDFTYLQMHAPKPTQNNTDSDEYLQPNDFPESSKSIKKSPNLPKKRIGVDTVPKPTNTSYPTKPTSSNSQKLVDLQEHLNYPAYELSPRFNEKVKNNTSSVSNRYKNNNIAVAISRKTPVDHIEEEAYEELQPPDKTQNFSTSARNLKNQKSYITENLQQESKFSFLGNIFKTTKSSVSRALYENSNVAGEKRNSLEVSVKNRPLPALPSSPLFSKKFLMPFPPPRNISPNTDNSPLENYVTLVNDLPLRDSPTPETQDGQIYGNILTANAAINGLDEEVYANDPSTNNYPEEQNYENGPSIIQKTTTDIQGQTSTSAASLQTSVADELISKFSQWFSQEERKKNEDQESQDEFSETDSEFDNDDDNIIYGNIDTEHDGETHINNEHLSNKPKSSKWQDIPKPKNSSSTPTKILTSSRNNGIIRTQLEPSMKSTDSKENKHIESKSYTANQGKASYTNNPQVTPRSNIGGGTNRIFNINEEPFYKETDRRGAKLLLLPLPEGAFLFRPSCTYFLTLSVKHNNKIFHFGIDRSTNNMLRLNTEGNVEAPEFSTLKEFVTYFSREPITFGHGNDLMDIYLTGSFSRY